MKTFTTIVALATLIAAPAFAQPPKASNSTVTVGGKYIGQDPDAAVRHELIRDYSVHAGGGE
jgi:hypothetical protein